MLHTRRHDGGIIVLRHLLVAAVQYCLIARVALYASLQIVRDQKPSHSAEIVVGVNVAEQPRFLFHIVADLDIGVATTRQYGNKEISLIYIAGNRIVNRERVPSPIHLHDIARFMLNAHGRLAEASPVTIPLTELRVHVRCGSVLLATIAVLRPEQRQIYAGLCQFPVNVLKIRLNVKGRSNRPCGKQDVA